MAAASIRVMVFPGTQTLPLYAAQMQGLFERRGLDVVLDAAPNSDEQRNGLAAGRYHVAHGAADQAVAMALAGHDAVVVAGGDNGFNHLFVQRGIETLADLRGRTLAADVAGTGWSFVLYEVLRQAGLPRDAYSLREVGAPRHRYEAMRTDGSVAAAILNPPYAIHARRSGLKDMGAVVDWIGPYQGTVPYVLRGWAQANGEMLVAYLEACIEGLRWSLAPENRGAAIALYAERLVLPADIATEIYEVAVDATNGLARDAALDRAGFANMLRLRERATGLALGPPERYVDLRYRQQALALAAQDGRAHG